jgi:hypothetical protein
MVIRAAGLIRQALPEAPEAEAETENDNAEQQN